MLKILDVNKDNKMHSLALAFLLVFSWPVVFTTGQELEFASDTRSEHDVFNSSFKVHTCCAMDLNWPETDCKPTPKPIKEPKSWTFPQHMMAENVTTIFPLTTFKASCLSNDALKVYFPITPRGEGSQKLLKNGYLKVGTQYYPPREYCISAKNETDLEFTVCPQECTGSRPCIKKCCSLDKIYSFGLSGHTKGCEATKGDYFKPVFYDDYSTTSSDIPDPHYIEHYPTTFKYSCKSNRTTFYLFPENTDIFNQNQKHKFNGLVYRIRKDGKIIFKHPKDGKCSVIDPNAENVCVDGAIGYGRPNHTHYVNDEKELVIFLCSLPAPENVEVKKVVGMLYGSVMLVSSLFLLLTILTYAVLWERQSVHGWTIVSHTVSTFFMYIFLGTAHIIGVTAGHNSLGSPGCVGIGIMSHLFHLSTFSWLFLISVDLWLTFRAFTPRSGKRSKGVSRYIKYSLFGWGVPLTIVIVGLILDAKYPENECHTLITPAYGKDSCYPQQKALGVYLYFPIAVMIGLVIVFFAITTFKLYLYRQSTKMATKDEKQAQFYRLFLKLFFVMGVLWVFDIISWATDGTGYYWYWVVFDMLNVLRALAVFIIFVCKRDIIFALEEKYPCLKPILLPFGWLFKTRYSGGARDSESVGHNSSMMTRTSTLRQTVSSASKPESINLVTNK